MPLSYTDGGCGQTSLPIAVGPYDDLHILTVQELFPIVDRNQLLLKTFVIRKPSRCSKAFLLTEAGNSAEKFVSKLCEDIDVCDPVTSVVDLDDSLDEVGLIVLRSMLSDIERHHILREPQVKGGVFERIL
jgi:hypothetical protein